jgi:hypothetical protein
VVAKLQSYDQPVEPTDRLPVDRNRSGDPVRLFSISSASVSTIYVRFLNAFYGSCVLVLSGVIFIQTGYPGRQFISISGKKWDFSSN